MTKPERQWTRVDYNEDGVDDVAISGNLFRMERMDEHTFWICMYWGKQRIVFDIWAENGKIRARVVEDSIRQPQSKRSGKD